MNELEKRFDEKSPKRILALDGGGIRGCVTVGFLEKIEQVVRTKLKNETATLSDYFDLIGGTSTGAIIAAQLALGSSVEFVKDSYLKFGKKVFSKPTLGARIPWLGEKLFTNWSEKPLQDELKAFFSPKTTLGSPAIKTGLCIVTKRADTFSTWPFINHPRGGFYEDNADIPLWKLLRASSAAPSYFKPIEVEIGVPGKPDYGVFIDGGVSMANNPALQLFLVATLKGFPFQWATGKDNLLLISVGTGLWERKLQRNEVLDSENIYWAQSVPELLMADASEQNELLLQYMSNSLTNRQIDYEVGNLDHDLLGGHELLSYVRYNAEIEQESLGKILDSTVSEEEVASLRDMAVGKNAQRLYEIGQLVAKEQVDPRHFPDSFSLLAKI